MRLLTPMLSAALLLTPFAHADTTYDLSISSFSINEGNTPFANVTGTVSGSISANFVAVAPSPERSSVIMLRTGIVGAIGAGRRNFPKV